MASPSRRRGDAGTLLREPRRRRRLKLPLLARRKRHEVQALEALVGRVGHGADADGEDRVERLPPAKDARRQQRKGDGLALLFLGARHRVHVRRPQERVAPRQLVALAVRQRVVIGADGVDDKVAAEIAGDGRLGVARWTADLPTIALLIDER